MLCLAATVSTSAIHIANAHRDAALNKDACVDDDCGGIADYDTGKEGERKGARKGARKGERKGGIQPALPPGRAGPRRVWPGLNRP